MITFEVSYGRDHYFAKVNIKNTIKKKDDIPGYFESVWDIEFYQEKHHICNVECITQYDLIPDILDITNALNSYFSGLLLYFAKYGKTID